MGEERVSLAAMLMFVLQCKVMRNPSHSVVDIAVLWTLPLSHRLINDLASMQPLLYCNLPFSF